MTIKFLLIYFLTVHFIADFYLQSNTIANNKDKSQIMLYRHCISYAIIFIVSGLLISGILTKNFQIFYIAILISIVHFVIDYIKYYLSNYKKLRIRENKLYIIDQLLHISTIILIVLLFNSLELDFISEELNLFASWILVVMVAIKPTSITIVKILDNYRPTLTEDTGVKNAGRLIGILERLIILFMLSSNQYSAIGFVLTAKSIARYEKISKDKEFAEYYLLGTLLSSLMIFINYKFVFEILDYIVRLV